MKPVQAFLGILMLFAMHSNAQVGISTNSPNAQLDIRSSSQAAPTNTDGILIPKVDVFPAVNPTVAQQGMLVYLNVAAAGKPVGFYYWDFPTLSWIGIASTINSDKDWLESATGLAPDDINDDMYHMGNTAIGKVTPTVPLDIENTTKISNILNTGTFSNTLSTNRSAISNVVGGATGDPISGLTQTLSGNGNGSRYAVNNTLSGNPFGDLYGMYNSFLATGISSQYGLYNSISNTGFGARYGVYNSLGGSGGGYQYGMYSVFNNTGGGEQRGVHNVFNGTGSFSNSKYGVHNQMTGANDSSYYGINNSITSAGTGNKYGVYNSFSDGTGTKYGMYTTSTSTQMQYGVFNSLNNTASGFATIFGVYSNLTSSSSSGYIYANFNQLSGVSPGDVYGMSNFIDNTGNGFHYGISNVLSGVADGFQYGISNALNGSGNSQHIGTYNALSGSGTGVHYAIQNLISGAGTGNQFAINNNLINTGNGDQYAVQSTLSGTGNGTHYGYAATLSGIGTGIKYGVYSFVNPTAGGTHYGVYSNAIKVGSYAGYFLGTVAVGTNLSNTYTLPPSRGGNGQTMQTDALGNVSWVNPNSGLSLSRANVSINQNLTTAGWQKITFDTELFDTNGEYNPAMARFTATKAGYYRVNAAFHTNGMANTQFYSIGVFKNGVLYQETTANHFNNGPVIRNISCVVSLAIGDYIEIDAQNFQTGAQIDSFSGKSFFEVEQIR